MKILDVSFIPSTWFLEIQQIFFIALCPSRDSTALKTIACVFTIKGSHKQHFHETKSVLGAKMLIASNCEKCIFITYNVVHNHIHHHHHCNLHQHLHKQNLTKQLNRLRFTIKKRAGYNRERPNSKVSMEGWGPLCRID